ncbi:MAG: GAF domain-containing protein [Planctomycetota bacterium]|nr:GAF domain-containing protein [Planctomycetota bacterium]
MTVKTAHSAHLIRRNRRLRKLTQGRKLAYQRLCSACADLTTICRDLQNRLDRQEAVIDYQKHLLSRSDDHEVFSRFFRLFTERTGPLFGAAMLCDENAELKLVGRFGVPVPDGVNFCQSIAEAMVPDMLERPEVMVLDAFENIQKFPTRLHRFLVGLSVLVVPLMVAEGSLIGVVVLYRKGEQPFTNDDIALARIIGPPTAAAAQQT